MLKLDRSEDYIKKTIDHWQPNYERELSEDDALEIINNMESYLNLLARWDRQLNSSKEESR